MQPTRRLVLAIGFVLLIVIATIYFMYYRESYYFTQFDSIDEVQTHLQENFVVGEEEFAEVKTRIESGSFGRLRCEGGLYGFDSIPDDLSGRVSCNALSGKWSWIYNIIFEFDEGILSDIDVELGSVGL